MLSYSVGGRYLGFWRIPFQLEMWGSTSFQKVDTCLPNYTASHPRGQQSSQTLPRQTKILHPQFISSSQSSKTKLKSPDKRGKSTILCILNFTFLHGRGEDMRLMMLGRLKYKQPSHYCLSPKCLRLKRILKSWTHKNRQVLIKLQHSWFKQKVRQYIMIHINLFFLPKMMKNWCSSGRRQSHLGWLNRLYQLSRHITIIKNIPNFIQYSSVMVNSIYRQNYLRWSAQISM